MNPFKRIWGYFTKKNSPNNHSFNNTNNLKLSYSIHEVGNKQSAYQRNNFSRFSDYLPKGLSDYLADFSESDRSTIDLNNFIIKKQDYFPSVIGKSDENYFAIQGECYGSYALEFFLPIFYWFESILQHKPKQLRVEFWYSYYNTSASRRTMDILAALDKYKQESPTAEINVFWFYEIEDIDMKEDGEDFQKSIKYLNFQMIGLEETQYNKMIKGFL